MLANQKLFVHLNGGITIRLPITVQGASRRVLSLSSSDMKATSQQEDDSTPRSEQLSSVAGGIVALGKFDALHIGNRELAIQAAKAGTPFLLSFTGMAEVLGWEPRAPVVAKCDRERVLSSWSACCGEVTPTELEVEFSKVRNLTPRQFVEKLSKELGVRGVVAGKNYRFGYRAAGDVTELSKLCEEYGIEAYIINPVMDKKQIILDRGFTDAKERGQVSSTRAPVMFSETRTSTPMVYFITDGAVEDERQICDTIQKQFQKKGQEVYPRINTFGIGSFCNHYFLRMLAMISNGQYHASYDADSIEAPMQMWFTKASSIMLTNIVIDGLDGLNDLEALDQDHPPKQKSLLE